MSTDTEHEYSAGEEQFTDFHSRRSQRRLKRNRESGERHVTDLRAGPVQAVDSQHSRQPQQPRSQSEKNRGKTVLYGKSELLSNSNLAAAKVLYKGLTFCVDNVSRFCSVDDMGSFISNLGVKLLSCFEVRTRLRRNEKRDDDAVRNRKAFRVRIDAGDSERMLNPLFWPNSIVISEWYFKSKHIPAYTDANVEAESKRRRIYSPGERDGGIIDMETAQDGPVDPDNDPGNDTLTGKSNNNEDGGD